MGYLRYSRWVGNLCQEICREGSVYIKHRDEVEDSTLKKDAQPSIGSILGFDRS